jgi:hypothetical protein
VIPLNTDVDIVYFLNVIEMYKFEVVIMINENFLHEYCQTQVGKGGGGMDEVHTTGHEHGDGGVDEVHMAGHEHGDGGVDEVHTVGHEHGNGGVDELHTAGHEHRDGAVDEVQMASREDGDGVNTNEQTKNYQATPSKSPHVQVKTKAARKLMLSKKTNSTASVPHCEQPSEHPTTNRGGTNDYIIIVLCIIFDYFKLKIVSELMFSAFFYFIFIFIIDFFFNI